MITSLLSIIVLTMEQFQADILLPEFPEPDTTPISNSAKMRVLFVVILPIYLMWLVLLLSQAILVLSGDRTMVTSMVSILTTQVV